MTIGAERRRAVLHTAEFLRDLARGGIHDVPESVRQRAAALLRHYPTQFDLDELAEKFPERWGE